jgi:integrase
VRTIRHAHRLLSKALKEGMQHDLIARNVAAAEQPPKGDDEDAGQVKLLVEKLRGRAIYAKAITALFTGIRRGELLALRWHDVDLDSPDKHLKIREAVEETRAGLRFKAPKTANGVRDVGLPDIVVEALRDYRRRKLELRLALGIGKLSDDALLFPKLDGSPQSPRTYSKEWADVAANIGLPVTFHALRHTHASHLIDAGGIDVVKISRPLGHGSPAITLRVYAHLFRKRDETQEQPRYQRCGRVSVELGGRPVAIGWQLSTFVLPSPLLSV